MVADSHWTEVAVVVVVNLATAAFVYGRLTERVKGQSERLQENSGRFLRIEDEQTRQWQSIGDHGERISRLEGARG
jgi:hypothetical protein